MRYLPTCATLVLGSLLVSAPAGAQALNFGSIGAGIKGGLNIAGASIDADGDEPDVERIMGLAIGGQVEFGVTSPFSLVLEPGYLQRGGSAELFSVGGVEADVEANYGYLEVPVLAKAKFGSIQTAHAFVFVGPSLGFLMTAEVDDEDIKDETAGFSLSGDVGAGAAYRVTEFVYVSADARYSHGFLNVADTDEDDAAEWMSRDIRLSLGVLFHLIQ